MALAVVNHRWGEILAEAIVIVTIDSLRWVVEEVHLTLKSGCRIERLGLQTAERQV